MIMLWFRNPNKLVNIKWLWSQDSHTKTATLSHQVPVPRPGVLSVHLHTMLLRAPWEVLVNSQCCVLGETLNSWLYVGKLFCPSGPQHSHYNPLWCESFWIMKKDPEFVGDLLKRKGWLRFKISPVITAISLYPNWLSSSSGDFVSI